MPKPGESCDTNGDIAYGDDGSVLVCRRQRWQRISEPPPTESGIGIREDRPDLEER